MKVLDMDRKLWEVTLEELRQYFADRAGMYDAEARFPHDHFDEIVKARFHVLPLDSSYGGNRLGFESIADTLVALASGCSSTALCLAMHYYTLGGLSRIQNHSALHRMFQDISENGHFISSFNQPNVMLQFNRNLSPHDMVKLRIRKVEGGYVIDGKKQFVSGSERFKYLPVYGYQEGTGTKLGITALLVTRDDPGVAVEPVWNLSGMKATMSHHVKLDEVFVPSDRLIGREGYGIEDTNELTYWSRLAIPSVYLGIAQAAFDHAVGAMKKKRDIFSQTSLAVLPGPQFALAEMRIKLETAQSQLRTYARQADREREEGRFSDDLFQRSLITKYHVTHMANDIVWSAMQLEGMGSLAEGSLLERLYRDVRAATFHQPSDDLLKEILAKKTLGVVSIKNRWG